MQQTQAQTNQNQVAMQQAIAAGQSGSTTITTMSPQAQHAQQISAADWGHGRVSPGLHTLHVDSSCTN